MEEKSVIHPFLLIVLLVSQLKPIISLNHFIIRKKLINFLDCNSINKRISPLVTRVNFLLSKRRSFELRERALCFVYHRYHDHYSI